jgi:hypothetical protein
MPRKTFEQAIAAAKPLQLKAGLKAIKKGEGKGQIGAKDPKRILGSVAIDEDLKKTKADAEDNRWDYVIGYDLAGKAVAHFVEVHGAASGHDISKMQDKLQWLVDFLQRPSQSRLAKLPRSIHWLASARNDIKPHWPQYRDLVHMRSKHDLKGPVKQLELA